MKLHLCCGDIYLEGYVNCDIKGMIGPEYANPTTLDNYYTKPFSKTRERGEYVVDRYLDILQPWPISSNSVERIVMISAIEHFTRPQAEWIIQEIYRVLCPYGDLIIDFPDIQKDIELYLASEPEFCFELIYCNQGDTESQHKWGYTKESFKKLLKQKWKSIEFKTIVEHDYPMIGCYAIKAQQ